MTVLILCIVLIGLAGLERIICIKKSRDWDKVRLFIGILITCLLFLISYFITDTAIDTFYVFLTIIGYTLMIIVKDRSNIEWLRYLSYIMGIPLIIYLLIRIAGNMLISLRYILLLLSIISLVLSYSYKRKSSVKENIALAIGIVSTVILMFSYYKLSGNEDRIMMKQELVAEKYLEEELDMHGLNIYVDNFSGSLRGEEVGISAYDRSGTFIIMIYKNNKIIGYEIEDNY